MVKDNGSSTDIAPEVNRDRSHAADNDVFGRNLNKNKQKKRGRAWKVLGVCALIVGAAGYGFSRTGTGQLAIEGGKAMMTVQQQPNLIFDRAGRDHVNILLIGRDVNWKISKVYDPHTKQYRPYQVHDESSPARSDTMILVSMDKTNSTIRMVSLPRDAIVHMPPNPEHVRRAKLNAAHAYGGPELLIKTIHDELGITVDHYAVIKFEGFKKLIDEVGGIEVDVDGALKRDRHGKLYHGNLDYDDDWGNLHIHLKPGKQRLTGEQAHNYVRFRMDLEGDPGRIRRQQQVMRALAKEIMNASKFKIPGLVQEVRQQFKTDMGNEEIASAAFFAKGLGDAAKIQPLTLFGSYYNRGSIRLNKPKNEKLLAYIFGETFNPDNFLAHSPSTTADELGPTNNATPAALAILRAAGVIKPEDMPKTLQHNIPVRAESTDQGDSTSRRESTSRRSTRVAVRDTSSDDASINPSSSDDESRSSRRERTSTTRRLRVRRHETTERRETREPEASSETRSESSGDRSSDAESPIPVPESDSSSSSGGSDGLHVEN